MLNLCKLDFQSVDAIKSSIKSSECILDFFQYSKSSKYLIISSIKMSIGLLELFDKVCNKFKSLIWIRIVIYKNYFMSIRDCERYYFLHRNKISKRQERLVKKLGSFFHANKYHNLQKQLFLIEVDFEKWAKVFDVICNPIFLFSAGKETFCNCKRRQCQTSFFIFLTSKGNSYLNCLEKKKVFSLLLLRPLNKVLMLWVGRVRLVRMYLSLHLCWQTIRWRVQDKTRRWQQNGDCWFETRG